MNVKSNPTRARWALGVVLFAICITLNALAVPAFGQERDEATLEQLSRDYEQARRAYHRAARSFVLSHPNATAEETMELFARFARENLPWRVLVAEKGIAYRDAMMYAPAHKSRQERNEARAELQGIVRQSTDDMREDELAASGSENLSAEQRRALRAYREAARELIDLETMRSTPSHTPGDQPTGRE